MGEAALGHEHRRQSSGLSWRPVPPLVKAPPLPSPSHLKPHQLRIHEMMESRFQDADTFRRVTGHASSTPSSQPSSHRTALPGEVRPSGADTERSPLVATWREAEGHGTLRRPQDKKAQAAGCTERDVRIKVCQLQNVAWGSSPC